METRPAIFARAVLRPWLRACALLLPMVFSWHAGGPVAAAEDDLEAGAAIYRQLCATCHGAEGQGVADGHSEPLVGDASVMELARIISDTMPEDAPETCVEDEALAVAAYIHHRFYSPAALVRSRPPRVALMRLTGAQLRQSLADLYGHFSGFPESTRDRGLRGTYFTGSGWKKENKRLERMDNVLDFDFGDQGPGHDINPQAFFIRWLGGVKADVTGLYELVIDSTCSFVCEFGGPGRVLINNHVQSGDQTEFRRQVWLTAGRVYHIQIDFVQRERKTEQPPARFAFKWVPPQGVECVVPTGNLIPARTPGTFSLPFALPPDDRSYGYDRGLAIDREWDDSTTAAALAFAEMAAEELWPQFRRQQGQEESAPRAALRDFLTRIVQTAFRGPLDESQRVRYLEAPIEKTADDRLAIRGAVLLALKSPHFLYPGVDAHRTPSQRAANRLALTLYDSLPADRWLREQVEGHQLETEAAIRAAAARMVQDYRLEGKLRQMLHFWLDLHDVQSLSKDAEQFANFDAQLVDALRRSFDALLDDVVWGEGSDFRRFFLAGGGEGTPRLADDYGSTPRWGLLTHPYLMSRLAYQRTTSPIHRGVFLYRHVLGRGLRPPQEAFTPLSPELHPELTTRERVALQTSPDSCQVCHTRINGLGFVLENFDAVGRFRETESGRPIDSSGHYVTRDDQRVTFQGVRELAEFLAGSDDARRAFVDKAFQYFVKQPPAAFGPQTLDRLVQSFVERDCHVLHLVTEIAVVSACHTLDSPPVAAASPSEE